MNATILTPIAELQQLYEKDKIYEIDEINEINEKDESRKYSKCDSIVANLIENILQNKEKTEEQIFIITAAYDKIFKKYNFISLFIMILSALVTLLEALRLSIVDFVNKKDYVIDIDLVTFVMNLNILIIGTIITILSSIIRFRNYREILEKLKDKENSLIVYREKYNKKYEKLLNLIAFDNVTDDNLKEINDKVNLYDENVKTINVLEYLRNDDIIKFHKYKAYFDLELQKIELNKLKALNDNQNKYGINISSNNYSLHKLITIENLKKKILKNKNNDST